MANVQKYFGVLYCLIKPMNIYTKSKSDIIAIGLANKLLPCGWIEVIARTSPRRIFF